MLKNVLISKIQFLFSISSLVLNYALEEAPEWLINSPDDKGPTLNHKLALHAKFCTKQFLEIFLLLFYWNSIKNHFFSTYVSIIKANYLKHIVQITIFDDEIGAQ